MKTYKQKKMKAAERRAIVLDSMLAADARYKSLSRLINNRNWGRQDPNDVVDWETIRARAEAVFVSAFGALADLIHADNVVKGFWKEGAKRNKFEMIALMHSELSEAVEYLRAKTIEERRSNHIGNYEGDVEEMADVIIRVMDYGAGFRKPIASAIVAKLGFNRSRPHKHGKKN